MRATNLKTTYKQKQLNYKTETKQTGHTPNAEKTGTSTQNLPGRRKGRPCQNIVRKEIKQKLESNEIASSGQV